MIVKTACLLMVSILLLACSPGDAGGLPPERPAGTLTGQAVAAAIGNAQVTVYGFEKGKRGTRLGGTVTDDSGAYTIDIQAPSQAILVEISGGDYVEEASGISVALTEGQILRAVGHYQSGRPLTLMVTPLTHMAAALAKFKATNGMAVEQAIDEANAAVDQFFALDTRATRPALITAAGDPVSELANDTLYGFYLAGLSNWTLWADRENQAPQTHASYNSIALAQVLYHDLRSDGLLDGKGYNQAATELEPLGFGRVVLDADVYRLAFSLHMLAMANSEQNKTGLAIADLLDAAHAIAAQSTMLPEGTKPVAIDGQVPTLTLQQLKRVSGEDILLSLGQFADQAHSGGFMLQVDVGGLLGAERLATSIIGPDGEEIDDGHRENTLQGSGRIFIFVDTTTYDDGEYTFELRATDALGKSTTETFRVKFDNTGPVITVTSPQSTNQATATLSGTFSDNAAGVAAITVGGREATLFTDDTWSVDVAIVVGKNTLPISVIDQAGNRSDDFEAVVFLDNTRPVIDSTDRHGQARFSNGDGTFTTDSLADNNAALYFETNQLELGTVPLTTSALDANDIPYFAFAVSDLTGPDAPTAADNIQVRMRYRRNNQVLSPWHDLAPVAGEYLVPLVTETLAPDWHRATPTDQHIIDIEVTDPAGNQRFARFDFRADFYVPAFDISNNNGDDSNRIDDLGGEIFTTTPFSERASLLKSMQFISTAYTFRNTTGKTFNISLNDDSRHTTAQTVEQLVREHRMHVKTTTEWRVGLMTPTDYCPEMTSWTTTSAVWNWTGSGWVEKQIPRPRDGAEEVIFEDTLPAKPTPSVWNNVPDFDQESWVESSIDPQYFYWTRGFDYILDPNASTLTAASVMIWTRKVRSTGEVEDCDPMRHFQQRETYAYESVDGYPKGVLSTKSIADTPDFTTTSYTLTDNNTSSAITPVNGWYSIPANHSVTIEKWVTTPELTLHSDDISNVINFPSYTPNLHDKTIAWSVARHLGITLAHDTGETNIPAMPQRGITAGDGSITYQISR